MEVRGRRFRRAGVSALAAVVASLTVAASAQALGVTVNTAAPASTNAGAKSDFTLDMSFSSTGGNDAVKDLIVHLPPGLVGDPTSTPLCTEADLQADNCADASNIGSTTTNALLLGVVPLTIPGEVFNVVPRTGEPARLGIVLTPPVGDKVILQSAAALRQSDFGLDTILEDLPNTADDLPITITGISLTLDGAFMRNPTSCGTKTTTVDVKSYADQPASGSASFNSVNCAALPFSPEFTGKIGAQNRTTTGTLPPQTTVISQDDGEAGLLRAEVLLPPDVGGNNAYFANACSQANFQAGTCPQISEVGTAVAESPLQEQALTGPVILVENPNGGLQLLGLDLRGALALKLIGNLAISFNGDQLETRVVFNNLPDIPISRFELSLVQDRLNVIGRNICEPPDLFYGLNFTSHANGVVNDSEKATIEGCAPPPEPVPPTADVTLKKATTKPRLKAVAMAGSEKLKSVVVQAPRKVKFANKGRVVAKLDGVKLPASEVTLKGRKATVAPSAAAGGDVISLKAGGGALVVKKSVKPGKPLAFKVAITDVENTVTNLVENLTARR